jgi:hypothetical protein
MPQEEYCYGRLRPGSMGRAENARRDGLLPELNGLLLCECGAKVGGRVSAFGSSLIPTRHYPYKEPRMPMNPIKKRSRAGK